MDILFENEILSNWLIQYGSIALFLLLVSGIIILPVPEETLMIIAGVLMSKGSLNIPLTILAAYAGSICGISVSYLLGYTAGHYLISKYGSRIGISEKHLNQVHNWFERFGKWTLMIGYFIPGVRHFTGFVSGMSYLEFRQFALFAYSGAIIWVSTFLSVGYFSGNFLSSIFENMEFDIDEKMVVFIIIAIVLYIVYYKVKSLSWFKSK
jgi:membrane protein DedA with SNARE-associated domain